MGPSMIRTILFYSLIALLLLLVESVTVAALGLDPRNAVQPSVHLLHQISSILLHGIGGR